MGRILIIKNVIAALNKGGVSYCILRNYDFLLEERPELKPSEKSIDMVVSKYDYLKFHQILMSCGFTKRKNPSFSLKHVPYFLINDNEIISFDVQIGGVHWNDICYLDEKFILKNRIKKSFFYVPSDNDTFVMLLVHSILGKRYFKPEYQEIILSLKERVDKGYIIERLMEIFSLKEANKLYELAKKGKFTEILNRKYCLIFKFIISSKENIAIFTSLFFRWLKWKKIGKSYPLISIIGPDGGGKSTAVENLSVFLQEHDRKVSVIYTGRGRSHILPVTKLGRIYKSKERKKDGIVKLKKPHVLFRKFLYTLAAPVFAFDLLLRYYFIMLPKRKKKFIVITDRYCSDIFLMENVPLFFRKFLLRLFPKPTLTFYLYNTPEVLHQRRPEESIEGLKRQLGLFKDLSSYLGAINIKTDNESETSEKITEEVMAYLLHNWY